MPNQGVDTDGDSPGRKRIGLACQRCRKRKIKCEPCADAGDGQPCVACQSAKSTDCRYLRVNSGEVLCSSPGSPNDTWQFSTPTNEASSYSIVPMANDLSQYSINNPSQMATVTTRTPYRATPSHPDNLGRMSGSSYATSPQRQYQVMPHHTPTGSDFYGAFPTQNGIPFNNNTALSPSTYAMQDMSQTWNSSGGCGAASTETGLPQIQNIDYGTLQYQEPNFSTAEIPSLGTDMSTFFPGLSPLASHLPVPVDSSGKVRCLTNPTGLQGHLLNSRVSSQASESSFSTANSQYTPENDSDTWASSTMLSDRNSGSATSSGGTKDNSSPTRREGLMYGYATPLDPNPMSAGNMMAYPAMSLPTPREHTDQRPRVTDPNLDTYSHGYARLPTLNTSFDDYQYSVADNHVNTTTSSEPAETATPRIHRLLQPQPRRLSYGRSSLSSHMEAAAKEGGQGRKSASSRRQERKYAGRHK